MSARHEPDRYRWCVEDAGPGGTHWSHPEKGYEHVHALCDAEFNPSHVCLEAPLDVHALCPECLSRMYRVIVRYTNLDGVN